MVKKALNISFSLLETNSQIPVESISTENGVFEILKNILFENIDFRCSSTDLDKFIKVAHFDTDMSNRNGVIEIHSHICFNIDTAISNSMPSNYNITKEFKEYFEKYKGINIYNSCEWDVEDYENHHFELESLTIHCYYLVREE